MSTAPRHELESAADVPIHVAPVLAQRPERWMTELGTLLRELEEVSEAHRALPPVLGDRSDNELVQVRLGIASSLFAALQCKHAATAGHALRVALTCSAWTWKLELSEAQRDALEVAALLHDIGFIGAPDTILLKPGSLDGDEAAVMARARTMSLDILRHSCSTPEILEIVEYVAARFDGSREDLPRSGKDIPLGARMIAIAEAFDAMTTDHVYRPAMSLERAMAELFACAGSQFDPELVADFADLLNVDPAQLHRLVAGRWLQALDPETTGSHWEINCVPLPKVEPTVDGLFQAKLLENMYDAVVFIDAGGQIVLWNRGAERLTGIAGSSIRQRAWQPAILKMADEKGRTIAEADCPVHCAIRSGVQSLRRLTVCGRTGRPVAVDSHTIPVMAADGTTLGAILLFHDASSESSLEQRCENLYEKSTKDPLTQVANRAEFDRVHEMFIAAHQQQQVPCSLLMCDLDRFKSVNDTYGHQAGDEAIKSLANLLKNSCRPGDLVARYGGEEFVMLCADCDNAAAARRAEQIRKALAEMPQSFMGGKSITVSFGVTEIQPGDTPETMLRRADRALLTAKSRGRNTVVQLGTGSAPETAESEKSGLWRRQPKPKELLQQTLVTPVPIKMAIEKLRGFVADHRATIVAVEGNHVELEIDDRQTGLLRRLTDRPVTFSVGLQFEEERVSRGETTPAGNGVVRTRIEVTVSPRKNRDRRRDDVFARAREVLASFRSYLMATEEESPPPTGALTRAKRFLVPWLGKK
jgi:diguanylate cyclase (GGDEF)-like protein/PAS domain S-box-containing protein